MVSLIQAYQLEPLVSIITKSQNINPDILKPRCELGTLSGLLHSSNHGRSLFTLQRLIAEAIADLAFSNSEERKQALIGIIDAVTYGEELEMRLLESLLNFRLELDIGPKVTLDNKIELYKRAVRIVRSKPLLLHLGRLQTNKHRFDDARKSLFEAHTAYVPGFDEREEHIKDAEGRLENEEAEDYFIRDKVDLAWAHLEEAERKFNEAKVDPRITPHPYTGIARTYLLKAKIVKEKNLQYDLIFAAAQECNYLEKSNGETPESYVIKSEITNRLSALGFNEKHLESLENVIGKANGYAYLAEIRYANDQLDPALSLVEKGLLLDPLSIWLMRLRVSILRRKCPGDHKLINETLDDYSAIADKYDVELSFELAKETYMSGNVRLSRVKFRELSRKSENNPRLLIHNEPEDRWYEGANAKRLSGTLIKVPTFDIHGRIRTNFPQMFEDLLIVRRQDLQYGNPMIGDRVSYEVIFNMIGPEASRVRKL